MALPRFKHRALSVAPAGEGTTANERRHRADVSRAFQRGDLALAQLDIATTGFAQSIAALEDLTDVLKSGVSGTFTTASGDAVTVTDGVITDIMAGTLIEPALSLAENQILKTYGDTVSVVEKGKSLNKFGTNAAVGTTYETVAQLQGATADETFVTTNAITSVVSDGAADTTQTIVVEGHTIDGAGNLTFVVQSVSLDGQTPVPLPTPLARAARAHVSPSGVFGSVPAALTGTVYVYDGTDGATSGEPDTPSATKLLIEAGDTQTQKCSTSTSSVDYWLLTQFSAGIGEAGGSANRVLLRLETRDIVSGGAWCPLGREITANVDQNAVAVMFDPVLIVPPNHDVRVRARTDSNTAAVFAEITGVLAIKTA